LRKKWKQVRRRKVRRNLSGVDIIAKRKKNRYLIRLTKNPGTRPERYHVRCDKNFGNCRSGSTFFDTKEELLKITTYYLTEMTNHDYCLERLPPEVTFDFLVVEHKDIEKIVTKAAILDHYLQSKRS